MVSLPPTYRAPDASTASSSHGVGCSRFHTVWPAASIFQTAPWPPYTTPAAKASPAGSTASAKAEASGSCQVHATVAAASRRRTHAA